MIIRLITGWASLAVLANAIITSYVISPDATPLSQGISLASNIYQSISGPSYSWTFWLQLSSSNQNANADLTIISVTSGTNVLLSLFISKDSHLSANYMTSSATHEIITVTQEPPPWDGWFLLAFILDASNNQAKIAWRRLNGTDIIQNTRTLYAPVSQLAADATLTLESTTAKGYLDTVTLYDSVLTDINFGGLAGQYPRNMHYVQDQIIGGTSFEYQGNMMLQCQGADSLITTIDFVSYGRPTGLFPIFHKGSCDAPHAPLYVNSLCMDQNACAIPVDNNYYGDPCQGYRKWMSVVARCSPSALSTGTSSPLMASGAARSSVAAASSSAPVQTTLGSALSGSQSASPPQITDRNGMQNGYRIKLGLALDTSSRSQTQNRVDARLAVRDIGRVLSLDVSRFVLVDIIAGNRTSGSVLTFTILSGSTPASVADGLNAALAFRQEMQSSDSELRQGTLIATASVPPVDVDIECVPLMHCPSGDYVCLAEASCPSSSSSSSSWPGLSTVTMILVIAAAASVLLALGAFSFFWWNRRKLATSTHVKTLPLRSSHSAFATNSTTDLFRIPADFTQQFKGSAGDSGDAAGFRLPRSGKHLKSRQDDGATLGVTTTPQGVANTISELEKTMATMDI